MEEKKLYIGSKLILAIEMDRHTFMKSKGHPTPVNDENEPGYQVIYPDGYVSWSPQRAFETAYREVTASEKDLF